MSDSEQRLPRVCHIVDELRIGGLEKTILAITLQLKGYEQEIWCLKRKGVLAEQVEKEKVAVREFFFEGGLKTSKILKLAKELKKGKFEIIHCHGVFPSIWGRLAAIFAKVPVRIVHSQNLLYGVPWKEKIKLLLLSYSTTRIIAVSEAVKKCLVEYIGIRKEKITVIYNSASDLTVLKNDSRLALRQQLGIDKDDFVIGCVGRLEKLKGHAYLIEAIARLAPKISNLKCVIVGEGPEKENLMKEAKALDLENRIIFTGLMTDVEKMYSAMDVFVLPSTLREGLPLVLAEAASASLPLIATDIGGNPEVVTEGTNGFIVPAKNAQGIAEKIQFLIDTPQARSEFGQKSYEIWSEKFTLQKMIDAISFVYEDSLKRR